MKYHHIPVLLAEVLEGLELKKGGVYIDCTLGGGGYTFALAQMIGKKGKVIAIDADRLAIDNAKKIIESKNLKNIVLVHNNFRNLEEILTENLKEGLADGIVFDLGLSSAQLADENRGFSFKGIRPLDMAFGEEALRDTITIINDYSLPELCRIFREYGEETQAYRLAKEIISSRKQKRIKNTADLVAIVNKVLPVSKKFNKINPATKIFQALRMETNDEIESLNLALITVSSYLKPGGRLVVVSFHSGEDRVVKNYLKQESRDCVCLSQVPLCVCEHRAQFKIITKKPITASVDELENNPRSRSAKLRVAEKI